jgi:hypothetical protein
MEMVVRSMETAETMMETDGDSSGPLPHPGRVPEQRLLSLEIFLQRRQRCGTVLGKMPIVLGFSVPKLFIGERTSSEVDQGGLTMGGRAWPSPWPPSGSCSVSVLRPGKIGVSELVSSNSENISYVAFLKHKNSRKQGTGTVASCQ